MKKVIILVAFLMLFTKIYAQKSISLAGEWKFETDSLAIGEQQHWATKSFSGKIVLPGSTDDINIGNSFPHFSIAPGKGNLKDYPGDADFGMLTRTHKYIGVAWYQREIEIKTNMPDLIYTLYLERVMWRSKVWIDGKPVGKPVDFLCSPHRHVLGYLSPGKHLITIMIDNRLVYPIGTYAHSYCSYMQTQWNGAIGEIELLTTPLVSISDVAIFSSFKYKKIDVEVSLNNRQSEQKKVNILYAVKEKLTGKSVAFQENNLKIPSGDFIIKKKITIGNSVKPWDEFSPDLYVLEIKISYNKQRQVYASTFGFRDLSTVDKHITINGRKIIYRNSHEGMFFGKTGYPAMDVDYWKRVFELYKKHGLNAVRFHSSCPPEAAFRAADELGIYLQVEFFWMDGWMGLKDLIGGNNESLNQFVKDEMLQALKNYGNHPSMMMVSFGNELGGDFNKMGEWIAAIKKHDSRHFYAAGIAHNITPSDDFVEYGGKGEVLKKDGTDWDYTANYTIPSLHNYDIGYQRRNLPEYTHETGQYVVHPLWSEIEKYNGVLSPRNLLYFRKIAEQHGVDKMDTLFQKASGNLNRIFYKAEIEATLRTPLSAGYGLLSMVDYPGQGEALIGWVNPFYENKFFLTPEEFKMYGNHTVPLIRFAKFCWADGEQFMAKVEVANYGNKTLHQKALNYIIKDGDKLLKEGAFPPIDILQGGTTYIGNLSYLLESGSDGKQLNVSLYIPGTPFSNSWDIWVFPRNHMMQQPENILITANIDEAITCLNQGGKVLLLADKLGTLKNRKYAAFNPVFWSATCFEGQSTQVIGSVIQSKHPAMRLFPTKDVADWQWKEVCNGARGFILNDLPKDYQPIVQPVNDYHYGNKLGSVFELKSAQGGKLLICGYNILDDLDKHPASMQLRKSLLHYMESTDFNPNQVISDEWLKKTFINLFVPLKKEKGFEASCLYVKAGANHTELGSADWVPDKDEVIKDEGIDYTLDCDGVWMDEKGSYWVGKKMSIEIDVKYPKLMDLKICFLDPNHLNRKGVINCEDMPEINLGNHTTETWVTIPVTIENCLDGKINVKINCTSGPNLMITKLALIPK
jgi:hypothetical protein